MSQNKKIKKIKTPKRKKKGKLDYRYYPTQQEVNNQFYDYHDTEENEITTTNFKTKLYYKKN